VKPFQSLREGLESALAMPSPEAIQEGVLKAFKRWFWGQGLDLDYLFL
jgi:hypothetical protein